MRSQYKTVENVDNLNFTAALKWATNILHIGQVKAVNQ